MIDVERIRDEALAMMSESERYQRIFGNPSKLSADERISKSVYSRHDLGLQGLQVVDACCDGGNGDEIPRALDKITVVRSRRRREAYRWIGKILGPSYYSYALIRKYLGIPIESPVMRSWNWPYFDSLIHFINPGGTIFIRRGSYTFASSVTLKDDVSFEGEGWAGRTSSLGNELLGAPLLSATTALSGSTMFTSSDAVNQHIVFRNLILYNAAATGTHVTRGIDIAGAQRCLIEGVAFKGYIKKPLRLYRTTEAGAPGGGLAIECIVRDCTIEGMASYRTDPDTATRGFELDGSDCRIERLLVGQYYEGILYLASAILSLFNHVCCTANWAFMISGGNVNRLIGEEIENNDVSGLELLGASRNQLIGCQMRLQKRSGLAIRKSSYNIVSSCHFENNSQVTNNTWDDIRTTTEDGIGSTYNSILGCFFRTTLAKAVKYNIDESGASDDNNLFALNHFDGGAGTSPILVTGTSTLRLFNKGDNPRAAATITVGASPYTYTNNDGYPEEVAVSGGTVSDISLVRASVTTSYGLTSGVFLLYPGDGLKVTYTAAPTMIKVPQ